MARPAHVKPSMGCGYVVVVLLAAGGAALLNLAATRYDQAGETINGRVVGAALFGTALLAGSAVYLRFARRVVRDFDAAERRRAEAAREPWKWRKEWQGPAIKSKDASGVGLTWFFALFWNGVSAPAAWAVFHQPHPPKPLYLVLLFPLIGLGLLWSAVYKTAQWRKFGRTRFVSSTMPGAIGGYLGGVIEVPARVALEKDARLALRCIRRTVTRSGKDTHTADTVLWQHEERILPEKWLTGPGRTDIPVLFYIPASQPQTDFDDRDNQVIWRLSAQAAVPGVDFATEFEVPVFRTGETAPPPDANAPVLDSYRAPAMDAAELKAGGVAQLADGWRFGASHLRGTRFVMSVIAAGLLALLGSFLGEGVHWIAWAVTGLFTLLAVTMAADLWTGSHELRIEGDDVAVRTRSWRGLQERRVGRTDVADVRAEKSMSIGAREFYRLILVGRGADTPAAAAAEPFRARKIRYQLKQLGKELGVERPEQMGERGAELLKQLAAAPRFEVVFAKHVPGPTLVELVRKTVLAAVQGNHPKPGN